MTPTRNATPDSDGGPSSLSQGQAAIGAAVFAEAVRYLPLMRAVESILDDGHMNQEQLACLRSAWEEV